MNVNISTEQWVWAKKRIWKPKSGIWKLSDHFIHLQDKESSDCNKKKEKNKNKKPHQKILKQTKKSLKI